MEFPPCPPSLKQINQFLKFAQEHDCRDIVVAFWARFYALEEALKLSKKLEEETTLLKALMDWLEHVKREQCGNEYFTNKVVARAYLESYALKLFIYADNLDRKGVHDKNVVKVFYSSGLLYHILQTFGELRNDDVRNQKYAICRATYINSCVRNGETPVPEQTQPDGSADDTISNISNISVLDTDFNAAPPVATAINKTASVSSNTETCTDSPGAVPSNGPAFESNSQSAIEAEPTVSSELSRSSFDGRTPGIVQRVKMAVNESVSKANKSIRTHKSDGTDEGNALEEVLTAQEVLNPTEIPIPPSTAVADISFEHKAEAKKHIGNAESALSENDVTKAVEHLQKALTLLADINK